MHSLSAPTRREAVLLIFVFVSLLLFSRIGYDTTGIKFWDVNKSGASPAHTSTLGESWRTRITWSSGHVPNTRVVSHVPGWTIFDNLFVLNGTVFVVTDFPSSIPDRLTITSTAVDIFNGEDAVNSRTPGDREMQIISTSQAQRLFGSSAESIDGVTWLVNDPPQFITHYYHWSAELFFGFWRTYSSLDTSIDEMGKSILPALRRIFFVHADADHWRDYALMNQWVLRSAFPSLTTEYSYDWEDRAAMGRPMILDRVIFTDRAAAMHGHHFLSTGRTAAEPSALPGSAHWWSTIRANVIRVCGLDPNVVGDMAQTPVITYISRQEWGRRMLKQEDHERLVEELHKLRDLYGYEVNVVEMDKLSRAEQFELAARTTIMMGVHGNGLTSLVWMRPSPRATVMEFFFPGGFAQDYEYTTRALGMVHYGFWGDEYFTSPDTPEQAYPPGFQGTNIPIDGAVVARLCHERLLLQ
ncbi:uncharacterized protein HD556DRAFT_1371462 [Suillus plorans]|uniref:Glycosyltransferase 61 catalytic domain-containing protein n=1 Tax=Suillus plorans TaxID=116603 RepID=A0A9P7AQE7_9AGAM|nr:uncharacterized protein HD556DRAFT_1371462 [Suillus plorans]KAG1794183.1 hypothetical protein HD556DRAFT_1371462 [Suillus plorans]